MATAITDSIETARTAAQGYVTQFAGSKGWTQDQTTSALADVDAAYDEVTGWLAEGSYAASSIFGSASIGEAQVIDFWATLADRAKAWSGDPEGKLRDVFLLAAGLQAQQSERTVSSVSDYAAAGVEVASETAADVATVATDRRTYLVLGVAAVAVLALLLRRR